MLHATDGRQKATVSNSGSEFIVLGEEPLADIIRIFLMDNDPCARHDGLPLENLAEMLKDLGITSEVDEEDEAPESDLPEGTIY